LFTDSSCFLHLLGFLFSEARVLVFVISDNQAVMALVKISLRSLGFLLTIYLLLYVVLGFPFLCDFLLDKEIELVAVELEEGKEHE
jgi:hypothetical protein